MLDKPSPLDPSIVNDLVTRWQNDRDEDARDRLVRLHMPVIKAMAHRYANRWNVNHDDAIQEANVGFLRAVDKFDPEKGVLEAYVRSWVMAKVSRARHAELPVSISSHAFNETGKVTRAAIKLRDRLGRGATLEEIAAEAGLSLGRTEAALAACSLPKRTVSMAAPLTGDEDGITLGDTIPADETERPDATVEEASEASAARAAIDEVVATFVPRHREFFRLRFEEGLPQFECGAAMGVNRQRAKQIEDKVVSRLREALFDNPAVLALLGHEPVPATEETDDVDGLLLNAKDVRARTGRNPDELTEMISRGAFPRPVTRDRRGQRLWRESAVERWRGERHSTGAA